VGDILFIQMNGRIFLQPIPVSRLKAGALVFDRTGISIVEKVGKGVVWFKFLGTDTVWHLPIKSKSLFIPVAYIPSRDPDDKWVAIKEEYFEEIKEFIPQDVGKFKIGCIEENGFPYTGKAIKINPQWLSC
jgi:hypothetical protein